MDLVSPSGRVPRGTSNDRHCIGRLKKKQTRVHAARRVSHHAIPSPQACPAAQANQQRSRSNTLSLVLGAVFLRSCWPLRLRRAVGQPVVWSLCSVPCWLLAPTTGRFRGPAAPLGSLSVHPTPGLPAVHWLSEPTFLLLPHFGVPPRSFTIIGFLHGFPPPVPFALAPFLVPFGLGNRYPNSLGWGVNCVRSVLLYQAPSEQPLLLARFGVLPACCCPDTGTADKRGGARPSRDLSATRSKTEPMARLPLSRSCAQFHKFVSLPMISARARLLSLFPPWLRAPQRRAASALEIQGGVDGPFPH